MKNPNTKIQIPMTQTQNPKHRGHNWSAIFSNGNIIGRQGFAKRFDITVVNVLVIGY
jgi:hypothetical protein